MFRFSFFKFNYTFFLIASINTFIYTNSAIAAESVVFKYGIFRESVSVDELTAFAETGKASSQLNFFLNQARQEPQEVRNVLTREINVSPIVLDRTLNNRIGEFLLDRISRSIHTPSNQANRQALRSSLVLSANKDNKVTLIEIIQNYPTTEIEVEGDRLVETYDQISLLTERLQRVLSIPDYI
jgi:Alpha/beta hydrolase of unknown function (DUF1400)